MARLIITRCFKSYDINAHGVAYTPLTTTATCGEEELLRLLCERTDVLVNKQDGHGSRALYEATIRGYVGYMRVLLDADRADVDGLNMLSRTALHEAVWVCRLEGATLLIEIVVHSYTSTKHDHIYISSLSSLCTFGCTTFSTASARVLLGCSAWWAKSAKWS